GRQDEVQQLLATTLAAQAPLPEALWAYLEDRPHGPLRELWVAFLLFFVLPGYYWIWYRRHSFDRKVALVAEMLEQGASLHHALRSTPGVASRETLLAVAVGQVTGQLAECLRAMSQARLAPLWLELLPRVLYPLLLLCALSGILSFWDVYLFPRMQRIY